ncbi:MAG: hypothetical protein ACI4HI_05990 [Lachnospiraceae bacterium]
MKEQITEALNELKETGEADLYMELLQKQEIKEPAFAEAALKQEVYHPAVLYKDASSQVRDQLIAKLDQELSEEEINTLDINGIMVALAAIGDEVVVDAFLRWEQNPPKWREKLYVDPPHYALDGGWCIENGRKRKLTYDVCYALQEQEFCEKEKNVFGGAAKDRCPHCDSKYVDILVLDGTDPRLAFLGINGKIRVKTCISCLVYGGFIFCKFEENGESKVICQEDGYGDLIEDEDMDEESCFVISEEPVSSYHCLEWEGSAIGGVPQYVDDANYAICPECGKRMKHLAQLDEAYTKYGTIYIQICTDCKIAATHYQQS